MTDREFLRRLRRYARNRGLAVDYRPELGKGSHAEVRLGERRTYLPRGEMKPGTLRSVLRDLGIDKREF
ncbi:type II toxin-antitoxin system HicA family toxin [Candidatus Poriferisodalis sp.]|uniref:type II toxin-antitoxin system HicA family toxin n=1 Tax=Candidatus Poriferisodalis sp. TaxID=3101277 RepID=UPI003B01926B